MTTEKIFGARESQTNKPTLTVESGPLNKGLIGKWVLWGEPQENLTFFVRLFNIGRRRSGVRDLTILGKYALVSTNGAGSSGCGHPEPPASQ